MFDKRREGDEVLKCSFCSKTQDQVDTLIANPSERSSRAVICNECVAVCNSVLKEHQKAKAATVEDRLRASVLEEHKNAQAANPTVAARLRALAGRP
jgi:ATP-dependent protease Clp ATPase subunit